MKWLTWKKSCLTWDAANQTWVFCKNSKHFQLQGHFLSPIFSILRNLHADSSSPVYGLSSVFFLTALAIHVRLLSVIAFCFVLFETECYCVDLAALELTMYIRLFANFFWGFWFCLLRQSFPM